MKNTERQFCKNWIVLRKLRSLTYHISLSLLMDMGKKKTKYNVLNLNSKFTVDQKHTLEHVFDALYAKYTNAKANDIIQTIIDSF